MCVWCVCVCVCLRVHIFISLLLLSLVIHDGVSLIHNSFKLHGLLKSGAPVTGHLCLTTEFRTGSDTMHEPSPKPAAPAGVDGESSSAAPSTGAEDVQESGEKKKAKAAEEPGMGPRRQQQSSAMLPWAMRALRVCCVACGEESA